MKGCTTTGCISFMNSFFIFMSRKENVMITVNGKQISLTSKMSVADYLEQNNYQVKKNRGGIE